MDELSARGHRLEGTERFGRFAEMMEAEGRGDEVRALVREATVPEDKMGEIAAHANAILDLTMPVYAAGGGRAVTAQGAMSGRIRPATEEETKELREMFMWYDQRPVLLFESGDTVYVVSQDDEGNGPGALVEVWRYERREEASLKRRALRRPGPESKMLWAVDLTMGSVEDALIKAAEELGVTANISDVSMAPLEKEVERLLRKWLATAGEMAEEEAAGRTGI